MLSGLSVPVYPENAEGNALAHPDPHHRRVTHEEHSTQITDIVLTFATPSPLGFCAEFLAPA